jgi:hypothetical protein
MRKVLITGTAGKLDNHKALSFGRIADKPVILRGTEAPYVGNDLEQYAAIVREMGLPEYIVAFLIQRVRLSETGDMI